MGTWVYGDLVVRVRTDRLTAYAAADGRVAWTVDAPGRTAVCTMSRDVVDGVGLVGWGADNERCTTVAAVDLRDGRVLWQRTRVAPQAATVVSDQVAVAQGVAVLVEESGLRAVGLRDNSERWQLPPQEECVAADVAAAPDQVTVLALCANQGVRVLAVDPATGRVRWQAGVPVEPPLSGVVLLRARPVVVHAVESGARGADDIITYSDEGRPLARIPRSGQDYDLALPSTALGGFDSWPARPDRKLVVTGDRLVVAAGEPRDLGPTLLVAYSLSTGQVQWRKTFDDGLVAVTEVDGEFVALDRRLVVHTTSGSTPVRGRHLVLYADLRAVGGAYVILAPDGTGEQPPAMGVR
jgi:outer membrane protein assembly factor BamB